MIFDRSGYRLVRKIYQGTNSEVWAARTEGAAPRVVAVKRLLGAAAGTRSRGGFVAEPPKVDHPHVLGILDVIIDPPDVFHILPWMAGGSLREVLDARGTLIAGELVAVLEPVVDGVTALADAGYIHGDLKPSNLLMDARGTPVVADLGSLRRIGRTEDPTTGTPAYLDPVAGTGERADVRSDVYSLGAIAYEALSGRRPHRGADAEVMALAAVGAHRHLGEWPGIDRPIAAVIEAALSPDPGERPKSPGALLGELASLVVAEDVILPAPARHRPARDVLAASDDRTIEVGPRLAVPARHGTGTTRTGPWKSWRFDLPACRRTTRS